MTTNSYEIDQKDKTDRTDPKTILEYGCRAQLTANVRRFPRFNDSLNSSRRLGRPERPPMKQERPHLNRPGVMQRDCRYTEGERA